MGKHSPVATKSHSPQLPPIHIHMSTTTDAPSPTREPKRHQKPTPSQPMSREHSWDRASGTASQHSNSSIHTADDSVFSEPIRRRARTPSDIAPGAPTNLRSRALPPRQDIPPPLSHPHPHTQPQSQFNYPHPSHIYDDIPRRPRFTPADDYPHNRDAHVHAHDAGIYGRPLPHRRNTQPNPFDAARYPPPTRAMSYAAGMGVHEPRYVEGGLRDEFGVDGYFDEGVHKPLYRRGQEQRRGVERERASEWDEGYYGGLGRREFERYGGFERRY